MPRYALNFVPEINSQWWRAGACWLGRDCYSMQDIVQAQINGICPQTLYHLTRKARRYGFHAQLKAPFELAQNLQLEDLILAINDFCQHQRILYIPMLQVQWIGSFLALQPHSDCPGIHALATRCLQHFHPLSAPLSESEQTKWREHPLTLRQQQLHRQWGHPYTEEEFRFHLRISDQLDIANEQLSSTLRDAAVKHFQLNQVMNIGAIALFYEAEPNADFQMLQEFPFGRNNTLIKPDRLPIAESKIGTPANQTKPADQFSDFCLRHGCHQITTHNQFHQIFLHPRMQSLSLGEGVPA